MPRRRPALLVAMLAVLLLPRVVEAGGAAVFGFGPSGFFFRGSFSGSDAAIAGGVFGVAAMGLSAAGNTYGGGWREDPSTLIVDVSPVDASVFLDGRLLGSAGALVARGVPLPLGPHVVQVQASGYRTRAWQFVADGSFPVRVRAVLAPE
ncbi:MAG TPA: PEGA domain-containing protein [Candidatus Binatia bacterium]|nr:PEGA domain-containing protein [Candidatus Binatia bacterium]